MELFPYLRVKTTNKRIGHYIHVPGYCAGSSSTWYLVHPGGGVPSCPYMSVSNSDIVAVQRNEVLFSVEKTEKPLYLESIYLWVNLS